MRPCMAYNSDSRGYFTPTTTYNVRTNDKWNLLIKLYDASVHQVNYFQYSLFQSHSPSRRSRTRRAVHKLMCSVYSALFIPAASRFHHFNSCQPPPSTTTLTLSNNCNIQKPHSPPKTPHPIPSPLRSQNPNLPPPKTSSESHDPELKYYPSI